jgi:hypothetical protein
MPVRQTVTKPTWNFNRRSRRRIAGQACMACGIQTCMRAPFKTRHFIRGGQQCLVSLTSDSRVSRASRFVHPTTINQPQGASIRCT